MDQYPFELKITIVGTDVFDFIDLLRNNGFDAQANDIEIQFKSELDAISLN